VSGTFGRGICVLICSVSRLALNEPGVQYECDACACDLTHSVRIKCADPLCSLGEGVDLCPACFCAGKEFGKHLRSHAYRVIVCLFIWDLIFVPHRLQEVNSYPIFTEDWGGDE